MSDIIDDINKAFVEACESGENTHETMLDWLKDCLDEGPSREVIDILIAHIRVLQSGERSWLLKPQDGRIHSDMVIRAKDFATDYIATCRKHGYDEDPMRTVIDLYGVTDRTVRNWKDGAGGYADHPKKDLLEMLEFYADIYRQEG